MKDSSSIMIEKPFTCDIDGCLMKFTNEDHLTVHKKRHDMVLNLGLGSKGSTFADQTPTPTRFLRNCDEVGLFQDLQNVNPFEETFKRAVEAGRTGQTPISEKSFQTNPSDDTLHTPNIFPHITGLPCVNPNDDLDVRDNRPPEDDLPKKGSDNNEDKVLTLKTDPEPKKLILRNISHKKRKAEEKPVVVEINDNQGIISEEMKIQENVPLIECNNQLNPVQEALKKKINNNNQNKQPLILQLKVPIPKSTSTTRYQRNQKDKFSIFTKNSLKFESKLEKSPSSSVDLNKRRRPRKNYSGLPKEKIDSLERNRAAATRCREKKKFYVSSLEKCNKELKDANKKLQMINADLRRQLSLLQTELLKHQNCSLHDANRESAITAVAEIGGFVVCGNSTNAEKDILNFSDSNNQGLINVNDNEIKNTFINSDDVEVACTVFQTVEVAVSENSESETFVNTSDMCESESSVKNICENDKFRKFYTDHSYFNYSSLSDTTPRNLQSHKNKPKLNFSLLSKDNANQNIAKSKNVFPVTQPGENSGFSNVSSDSVLSIVAKPLVVLTQEGPCQTHDLN
ncbi:UNVERIFIED_CONTAM: hypothetical protein PYX00_003592 [Menopon gallinae]|uniref:Cyclic AMP-dependent transcription factor ATF-2 n=1 Tax=Menopon gallinae TaxID=328185 RepID=A0AAW2I2D2_9NEOP